MPNEGIVLDNPVLRIEKGRISPPSEDEPEPRGSHDEHIPWGYGRDRITAMSVDPNRLYLYWEVTDPTLDKARGSLGAGAKDAWVSLRIYDVTGRIFDGTNAHGYFDIKVDRSDRQWFVHVGKPASTHVAEIGLKSMEGYFVKIARSGRVDFPRFEPSPDTAVEWLTVRTATGPVDRAEPGGSSSGSSSPSSAPSGGAAPAGLVEVNGENKAAGASIELYEWSWAGWEELLQGTWKELFRTRWRDGHATVDWSTPIFRSAWEAGPFAVPVETPRVTEEFYQGPVTVIPVENGKTRIVYGPWHVVMRGLRGHAEKRVLARWEVAASWVVEAGVERVIDMLSPAHLRDHVEAGAVAGVPAMVGSSGLLGASERRWLAASELRFRGASEVYYAGASELRWGGASEILAGSERRLLGASEILAGSERRLLGASERLWLGGSEKVWLGSSEQRLGGAVDEGFSFAIDDGASKLGGGG
jgi:hypothetical protein